ncbi:MAG: HK97 family phage prohead protease [Pseudomonadota bacterium]
MGAQLRPNRRATFAPATLDRSSRTVDAVLATDAIVARAGMAERLTITAEAVDLSRAPLPVLDGHRAQSADDILGVLEDIRIEDGRLLGTLRIAPGQRGDGVLDKIEASILQSVSIGYVVNSFRDARGDDGRTVRTVTRFTLYEASLVALPVDPAARIRAVNEEDNMNDQIETAPAVAPEADAIAARAAVNVEIRGLAETAGLDREWADQQIDAHASLVEARAAAFEAIKARGGAPIQTARATVGDGQEDSERVIHGMAEALSCRANPALEPSAAAKPYLNRRLLDLARDRLEARCISTRGLSDAEVTHRSMTTSDLPLILGTTVNRELRRMYEAQPDSLRHVASQRTALP